MKKFSPEQIHTKFLEWAKDNGYNTDHAQWGVSIIFKDYNTSRAFQAFMDGMNCAIDFVMLDEKQPENGVLRVRAHRELLSESIQTMREVRSMEEFHEYFQETLPMSWQGLVTNIQSASHQTHDARTGWDQTYIITLPGYGVLGFADGPLDRIRRGHN